MNKNSEVSILILGAGPTGLSVGLGLTLYGGGKNSEIVERGDHVGGLAGSFKWKNHIVDFGPHRLAPNIEIVRVIATELLGPDCLIQKSQHGIQLGPKLYQFPPRVVDWLSPRSIWMGLRLVMGLLFQRLVWIVSRFETDTFETLMISKFGNYFYREILEPMATKVWIEPSVIDPSFVNLRFEHITAKEVIRKKLFPKQALNPTLFYYPREGFQQLWDQMANSIKSHGVICQNNSTPLRIEVSNQRITKIVIKTPEGEVTHASPDLQVVSTIPIISLLRAMEGPPDIEELRTVAATIKFKSMLLVCFEFSKPKALPFRTLIYPGKEYCFNRIFEQNEYSRETVAEGHSVIVADITVPRGDEMMKKSDAEIVAMVKRDLSKLKYIEMDKISDVRVERVEFAYVVPDLNSRRAMHTLQHAMGQISNLHMMGRFSVGEYDNSDYAIDNGIMLGGVLAGKISRHDYLLNIYKKRNRSIVG